MKKALLLHGWEGNSHSNWFPWLKRELEAKQVEVFVPDLPESHSPILEDHLDEIKKYTNILSDGDYIIGHSMGAKLAMHFIEENSLKNLHCILVGPTYDTIEDEVDLDDPIDVKKNLVHYNGFPLNFKKINLLNNTCSVLLSDNDRFIRVESAKKYYSQLENVVFKEFSGYGHFLKSDGFEEFSEILNYIK